MIPLLEQQGGSDLLVMVMCRTGWDAGKYSASEKNRCLGRAKPVLAAYGNQPPVLCFLLPRVGLRHHLSSSGCRVALADPVPYQVTLLPLPPVPGGSGGSPWLGATSGASAGTPGSWPRMCTEVTRSKRKQGRRPRYCVVCRGHEGTCQVDAGMSAAVDEMVIAASLNGCML